MRPTKSKKNTNRNSKFFKIKKQEAQKVCDN